MQRYEQIPNSNEYIDGIEILRFEIPPTLTLEEVERRVSSRFPLEVIAEAQLIEDESSDEYLDRLFELYPYEGQGEYLKTLFNLCSISVFGRHTVEQGVIDTRLVGDVFELHKSENSDELMIAINKQYTGELIVECVRASLILNKRTDLYMSRIEEKQENPD